MNFFDKFNGDMVRIGDKANFFKLKSKGYAINKEDHELPIAKIINISSLLVRGNHNQLYQKLEMRKSKINDNHEMHKINVSREMLEINTS